MEAMLTVDKGSSRCFDDAKRSLAPQSFIQDKAIKDIQDG